MSKKHTTRKQLTELLGISDKRLAKLLEAGAPKSKARDEYDAVEFCRWIIARPKSRTDKSDMQQRAQRFLSSSATGAKPADFSSAKKATVKASTETGLMPALERARAAELAAYENHIKIQQETGFISSSALDAWQKTLDILRKCEKDFTDVLKQRRELIEIKRVQEWLEQRNDQAKQMLLNLPAKVAPALEGLPWHEIQKILTQEVREVVCKLGNIE